MVFHTTVVFHGSAKDKKCDLCSETFFSEDGVQVHKNHAHVKLLRKIDDNNVTQDVLNIAMNISKKVDLTITESELEIISDNSPVEQREIIRMIHLWNNVKVILKL